MYLKKYLWNPVDTITRHVADWLEFLFFQKICCLRKANQPQIALTFVLLFHWYDISIWRFWWRDWNVTMFISLATFRKLQTKLNSHILLYVWIIRSWLNSFYTWCADVLNFICFQSASCRIWYIAEHPQQNNSKSVRGARNKFLQLTKRWQQSGPSSLLMSTFLTWPIISQSGSYPIILTRLGGHRSRPNLFKIVEMSGIKPVISWLVPFT